MPATPNTSTTVSSFLVPVRVTEDTVDGLFASRPWQSNINNEDRDNHLTSSQSWPPAAEFMTRRSFGVVDDELDFDYTSEAFHKSPSAIDSPSSAAAAFLSSFAPLNPFSESISQTIAGYELGATIGHGGFSTIRLATSPSGGTVAVKIVRHTAFDSLPPQEKSRHRSRLSHEARVWVSLSHENILPLFDSYQTSEATFLVTLYCPAGSLFDILKREGTPALEQTDTGCMFRQVVKGLQYMHESMFLVHGDIKLENVLVDESGVCRLTDFGLSRRIGGDSSQVSSAGEDEEEECHLIEKRGWSRRSGTSALPVHLSLIRHGPQRHRTSLPLHSIDTPPTHPDHTFLPGSLPYAAPELLLPHARSTDTLHRHNNRPTAHPAQDMWALGVLLYALLTGALPFQDSFEPRLQMKILRGTYEMPSSIGPLAESVLKGCLESDLNERWTISMVDDGSWGIGYGNVDVDPVIREEQRSQSQSRTRTPLLQSVPGDDPSACMTSCSLSTSVPVHSPKFRGRPPRIGVRTQSRSPSPSVAPRTPDDDDDEGMTYFGTRCRHRQRDSDDVQIVLEDEDGEWDSRERVYDEERVGGDSSAEGLPMDDEKLDRLDAAREKQAIIPGGGFHDTKASHTNTRSWSLTSLAR